MNYRNTCRQRISWGFRKMILMTMSLSSARIRMKKLPFLSLSKTDKPGNKKYKKLKNTWRRKAAKTTVSSNHLKAPRSTKFSRVQPQKVKNRQINLIMPKNWRMSKTSRHPRIYWHNLIRTGVEQWSKIRNKLININRLGLGTKSYK